MFGNVTAPEGWHVTGKYRTKHDAHMLQACGLGSSQGGGGVKVSSFVLLCYSQDMESRETEFFIDNLLVRIHLIIEMIRWTGLAQWEFEFPFPGSLTSTFLKASAPPFRRVSVYCVFRKPRND